MSFDLRISLKKLELFCLVAELESFGKAADRVYVTQPVVTSHMRDLGARLGIELFVREGHRMVLTEQGRLAYEWARETLARTRVLARHLEETDGGDRGTATISASMTLGHYRLPSIVSAFKRTRPAAVIALHVLNGERVLQGVENSQHDFGVAIVEDGPITSPGIVSEPVGTEELVLVGPTDDRTPMAVVDRADFAIRPLVASPRDTLRHRLVTRLLTDHDLPVPPIAIELGSAEAMKRAVLEGLGRSFMFRSSVADELERGTLRELVIPGVCLLAQVHVLTRDDRRLTPLQAALLDAVRRGLSSEPAGAVTPTIQAAAAGRLS